MAANQPASDQVEAGSHGNERVTRREVIALGAGAVAATIVPRSVLGGPGHVPPSATINVGMIGCGGRARQNLKGIQKHSDARVIAIADPARTSDSRKLTIYRNVTGRGPFQEKIEEFYGEREQGYRCAAYEDFQELLAEQPDMDAVVISTPDHQHAHAAVHCMKAGKHVYCEKPLTHNLREASIVRGVARETGVATQMGNQGHAKPSMAETVERVRAGHVGTVTEVHAWVPTKRWNPTLTEPPSANVPVPDGLNWDLWIGPRDPRPFQPEYAPVRWRDFWDFGCGALGDFACHDLDSATWSLGLTGPTHVEAFAAGKTHDALAPHGCICRYEFPAIDGRGPVRVTWYDGGLMPELPAVAKPRLDEFRRGVMFVGDEGHMLCKGAGGDCWVIPKDGRNAPDAPSPSIRRVADHYRDWLDACKGGPPALSNFEYATRLTEITLLGVLALRVGKPMKWDSETQRVVGKADTDPMIQGVYRDGWDVST